MSFMPVRCPCADASEMMLDITLRAEQTLFFAAPQTDADGAAGWILSAFRMRMASIMTMVPAPCRWLGAGQCQESRWRPA